MDKHTSFIDFDSRLIYDRSARKSFFNFGYARQVSIIFGDTCLNDKCHIRRILVCKKAFEDDMGKQW
jgi:hypothetical protein